MREKIEEKREIVANGIKRKRENNNRENSSIEMRKNTKRRGITTDKN